MIDLTAAPYKDWMPAIIGGLFVLISGAVALWHKSNMAREAREVEDKIEDDRRDAAQAQDLTARFRALMDGYENHIKNLTSEVAAVKTELRALTLAYETRTRICNTCPIYVEHVRKQGASTSTS